MGSVTRRENGRWRAQVWVVDPGSGKRRRVSKIYDRKRDAEDWVRKTESSPPVAEGTVGEMLDRYLAREDIERSTRTTHRGMMKYLDALCPLRLSELKLAVVEQHFWTLHRTGGRKGQGLSAATVQRAYKVLRAAANNDVRLGLLPYNPVEHAKLPDVGRSRPQAVSPEDVETVLAALGVWPAMEAFVRLAVISGCRRGELVALTWDKVGDGKIVVDRALAKDENRQMYLKPTKEGDIRVLRIDPETAEMLEMLRRPEGWVFSDDDGKTPWDLDVATQRVRAAGRQAGVKVTLRGLRHSVATYLLSAGMSPVAVANRLGHANPSMTMNVYAEHVQDDDVEAAQIMATRLGGGGADDDDE